MVGNDTGLFIDLDIGLDIGRLGYQRRSGRVHYDRRRETMQRGEGGHGTSGP